MYPAHVSIDRYIIFGNKAVSETFPRIYPKLRTIEDYGKLLTPAVELPKFLKFDADFTGYLSLLVNTNTEKLRTEAGTWIGTTVQMGYETMNIPLWYGPVIQAMMTYQSDAPKYKIMAGYMFGLKFGKDPGPLGKNPRTLNGGKGPVLKGEYTFSDFSMAPLFSENLRFTVGGDISYSFKPEQKGTYPIVNSRGLEIFDFDQHFYYIADNFLGYVGFEVPKFIPSLRLNLGYQVFHMFDAKFALGDLAKIDVKSKNKYSDFWMKVQYSIDMIPKVDFHFQYFNNYYLFYLDIQPFPYNWAKFLHLNLKYSKLMGRDPAPWEYKDYIAPFFRLSFFF